MSKEQSETNETAATKALPSSSGSRRQPTSADMPIAKIQYAEWPHSRGGRRGGAKVAGRPAKISMGSLIWATEIPRDQYECDFYNICVDRITGNLSENACSTPKNIHKRRPMKTQHEWTDYARSTYSEHQLLQAEELAKNVGEVTVYDQAEPWEQAAMLLRLLNSRGYTVTKIK